MSQENDVSAVLQQYAAETGVHSVQKVEQDFVAVAQRVPAEHVTTGLVEAMQSERTPPFEDMVGDSFERGSDDLRTVMVRRLARAAVQADPSVIERMSEFFAVDPAAGRTLGGAALSVALGKIAEAR